MNKQNRNRLLGREQAEGCQRGEGEKGERTEWFRLVVTQTRHFIPFYQKQPRLRRDTLPLPPLHRGFPMPSSQLLSLQCLLLVDGHSLTQVDFPE